MDFPNKTRIRSLTKKRISDSPFVYEVNNRPVTPVTGVNRCAICCFDNRDTGIRPGAGIKNASQMVIILRRDMTGKHLERY